MAFPWWAVGVSLSLIASFFGTVGKILMKLAHKRDGNVVLFGISIVCVVVLNPVFDAISYGYAAQSILAPMAGVSIVWSIVLAPFVLQERIHKCDIQGTILILMGSVLVSLSGSHQTPNSTVEQLFGLFHERAFAQYTIAVSIICLLLAWSIFSLPKSSAFRRFAFGVLSGLVGGNLFFLKTTVELIGHGGVVWTYAATYIIILCALLTAGGGMFILSAGLKEYDALYLVPVYESLLIIIGSSSGILFFHETRGMHSAEQKVLYTLSICLTILGIVLLSLEKRNDSTTIGEESEDTNSKNSDAESVPLIKLTPPPESSAKNYNTVISVNN